MCVWACVCVHMCGLLSLSPSARPLCQHTLQRAPSCHSRRHTALKNDTMRGRGETKREEYTKRKWRVVWVWSPTNHPITSVGLRYLLCYTSFFLRHNPHTHTHTHTQCFIWCMARSTLKMCLNMLLWQGSVGGFLVLTFKTSAQKNITDSR